MIKNPTILCIDIGTQTGWAMLKDGKISSGSESFPKLGHEGFGMRFMRFKRWLTGTKAWAGDINIVFYESVHRHSGILAAHIYGGLLAHLAVFCEHHGIHYAGLPVGGIKKHFTGNGAAKKPAMIAECIKRGYSPADDNEADAIAMLHLAMSDLRINQPL